jgi:uncharacterized CHY-type Zn-finger protein
MSFEQGSLMTTESPTVRGLQLDADTRCFHHSTALDVIAIRMKCCGLYYACKDCHHALAGHPIEVWPRTEWDQKAVLCGVCRTEMAIHDYLESDDQCPACQARFNPGCRNHYGFYFAIDKGDGRG